MDFGVYFEVENIVIFVVEWFLWFEVGRIVVVVYLRFFLVFFVEV